MIKAADLPDVVPVFPLTGALMLPRARLPLHIFEPRYLAMLDDALKSGNRLIGMVQPNEIPGARARGCNGSDVSGGSPSSARPRTTAIWSR